MSDLKGFAVEPKLDCPHLRDSEVQDLIQFLTGTNSKHFSELECAECKDTSENWVCLNCRTLGCSRYVKSHMAEHNASTKHTIALSFSDASFWCYDCDSYIDAPSLRAARKTLSDVKFASPIQEAKVEEKKEEDQEDLAAKMDKLNLEEKKVFTIEDLVEGLKGKNYKNVVFLTGAGMSVAAGIPDFRTPGTGLYSKMKDYNLPRPEAVFDISYFEKHPEAFTKLAKEFFCSGKFQPTLAHKFMKKLNDDNMLLISLTQNIDGLEIQAGLPEEKLIQAHGHSRKAHCIKCKKEADIEEWRKLIEKQEIMKCQCQGLVKPDIVFFGEQLPQSFYTAPDLMQKADLVFIIGTALAVMPFAFLPQLIEEDVPVVLINNTDSLPERKDKLWMNGNIDDSVKIILEKVQWKL